MSIYALPRRVACYVTRTVAAGQELLVFDHADDAPGDSSGTRVPAGGMLPFEALADAARREVEEETGLVGLDVIAELGVVEQVLGERSVTSYVHLAVPAHASLDTPSSWQHTVTGGGGGDGLVFVCRWELLPLAVDLAAGQDAMLAALAA